MHPVFNYQTNQWVEVPDPGEVDVLLEEEIRDLVNEALHSHPHDDSPSAYESGSGMHSRGGAIHYISYNNL